MSEAVPLWQCHFDALVPHGSELCVLLLHEQVGWVLPSIDVTAPAADAAFPQLQPAFEHELGMQLTVLRRVSAKFDKVTHQATAMLLIEQQRPSAALPPGAQWVGLDELRQLPLAHFEQRELIVAYLSEAAGGEVPALRPPWARLGWYKQAVSWIEGEVARLGYELQPPIVQLRSWSLSCVLRVPTWAGDLYFKEAAALPLFANEPAVTAGLAALFPDHIPVPLAIDPVRRWMLLPDLGPSLHEQPTVAARHSMLAQFVQLQRAAVEHVPHLLAIGCLDRRLDRLAAGIVSLVDDADVRAELTGADAEQLREQMPQLMEMCTALAHYRVPETLVHGDLNLGNVAFHGGQYQFFDWTDACVSHPFFDLVSIVWEKDAVVRAELLDAYLALWTDFEPLERLWDAWKLAEPLCCLHQAISYQHILTNVDEDGRQEFHGAVAGWVRRILAALAI